MPKTEETTKPVYQDATGPVVIKQTNDYLFKALMQKNHKVLHHLICSLLHTTPDNIKDAKITNPIILGESVNEKDIILDINVLYNDGERTNLEMQVTNEHNWPERSTYYACRNFTDLNLGQDYGELKPVHQIGILDFTPLPEHPKFYSHYQLRDVDDYYTYTDKFNIVTLDLTNIELASKQDKAYNVDKWARFFKAATWEELKMLAEKYDVLSEAAATVYQLSEDERIRLQCQAREDYEKRKRSVFKQLKQKDETIEQQAKTMAQDKETIAQLTKENAELKALLAKQASSNS